MELVDVDAARRLVEPIDVLGHHGLELARLLQLRQLQMGSIGFGVRKEHLVVVEAVELLRILLEEGVAQNGLRGILVLLVVQAVHAAEIRDAALGRYARPAEKDDILTLVDPLLELFQFLIHTKPSLRRFPVAAVGVGAAGAAAAVAPPLALQILMEAIDQVDRRPDDEDGHPGVDQVF